MGKTAKEMDTAIVLEGIYWESGRGNGDYYSIIRCIWGECKRKWKLP